MKKSKQMSTHEIECECPICILCGKNTQVCDFLVNFDDKNKSFSIYYNGNDLDEEQKKNLMFIAVRAKQQWKLKVGDKGEVERDDHRCYIERKSKSLYKVCFHTTVLK